MSTNLPGSAVPNSTSPVVASPNLLSRIETLVKTLETKIVTDAKAVASGSTTFAADVTKVESAATKYWMAIAGFVAGIVVEHLLKFL